MRINLNQGYRSIFFCVCLQQWIANRMVSTKAEHFCTRAQNQVGMALNCGKHALRVMRIKIAIAIINDRQMIERIETKRKMFEFGKLY